MIDENIDLRSLRRTSTRAGLLSLVGALIAFAGLGYAGYRLRAIQDEVSAVEARIAELRPHVDELETAKAALVRDNDALTRAQNELVAVKAELEEERTKLTTEVESLRSERDRLREGYTATLALAQSDARLPSIRQAAVDEIKATLPISAIARPRASREPLDDRRASYVVWLEVPGEWSDRIERVSYLFNHESFRTKNPWSTDSSDGFRVAYVGWGCLDSVVATVTLKNGGREKLVFDMCALLRRDGVVAIEKEPPARASAAVPEIEAPKGGGGAATKEALDGGDGAATKAAIERPLEGDALRPVDDARPIVEQRRDGITRPAKLPQRGGVQDAG